MKRRQFCFYVCLLCCLFVNSLCSAQIQPVTNEWKQKDARLSKNVTIWHSRIRLSEILTQMKDQTGVSLGISRDAGFSGIELCVYIKDKPLSDVMNALWSFLSMRRHAYQWERSGKSDCRYILLETSASKQFPKDLLDALQAVFAQHQVFGQKD